MSALSQSWGGTDATLSSGADRKADEAFEVEQEQVMASAHLSDALQGVAAAGGLAAKNAEHYFGNLDPSKILMVRQRRCVSFFVRNCGGLCAQANLLRGRSPCLTATHCLSALLLASRSDPVHIADPEGDGSDHSEGL